MPFESANASETATVTAPDGIQVHTFALPPAAFIGVAEGRIPPGRYAIHRHQTLEQYTYVLSGALTIVTGTHDHPGGVATEAPAGALHLALPGESLQFINSGQEVARVLFICSPPYSPDHSDVRVLQEHGQASGEEAREAIERLEALRSMLNVEIDARVAALRTGLSASNQTADST